MAVNDENTPSDTTPTQKIFEWEASPTGNIEVYSNINILSWSLVDVRIQCGKLMPEAGGSKNFVIREQAAVTMAWYQAKVLANSLADLIKSYEKENGEIKLPKLAPIP
jgi:hypothetical protein